MTPSLSQTASSIVSMRRRRAESSAVTPLLFPLSDESRSGASPWRSHSIFRPVILAMSFMRSHGMRGVFSLS